VIRPHDPECYCDTCSALGLGAQLYREIAEELGSDDPEVIDPIWRARSEERLAAHKSQRIEAAASLFALLLLGRRYAAA
jgi:hypothetical protein